MEEYGTINYAGNYKKFVTNQNNLLKKWDDDTVKIKWIGLSGSFTL